MEQPISITLNDDTKIIINELQVSSIHPLADDLAEIHMSNGEIFICKSPGYGQWENDYFIRRR